MSAGPTLHLRLRGRFGAFGLDAELDTPLDGVTVITGASGSGKTTLLRCIAGLDRVSGALRVGDEIWQGASRFVPPHRRDVGLVFQDARLLPHLSVRGNLAYGLERARGERRFGMDETVALLGLGGLLGRSVKGLSGGEQQRIAIGRALLSQPRLLLMDEPTASLDVQARADVLAAVEALPARLGVPVLYVTHDPVEARRLATRRLGMAAGRLVEVEDVPDLAALAGLSAEERDRLALAALRAGLPPAG